MNENSKNYLHKIGHILQITWSNSSCFIFRYLGRWVFYFKNLTLEAQVALNDLDWNNLNHCSLPQLNDCDVSCVRGRKGVFSRCTSWRCRCCRTSRWVPRCSGLSRAMAPPAGRWLAAAPPSSPSSLPAQLPHHTDPASVGVRKHGMNVFCSHV